MEKSLDFRLNKAIEERGADFGPSLVRLLKYGPLQDLILESNVAYLSECEKVIEDRYNHFVIPKLANVVKTITKKEADFPSKVDLPHKLKVRPLEEFKKIIRLAYLDKKNQKLITLDDYTKRHLLKDEEMQKNTYRKFFLDKAHNYVFSTRMKQAENSSSKYERLWKEILDGKNLKEYEKIILAFAVEIAEDPKNFWTQNTHKSFEKSYGLIEKMMLGDYFGLKIVDLDQKRASQRLHELEKTGPKIAFDGFRVSSSRYNAHLNRAKDHKPGGIHYTLIDSVLDNFPVEVQLLSLTDQIYDISGPFAHPIYSARRENGNITYRIKDYLNKEEKKK